MGENGKEIVFIIITGLSGSGKSCAIKCLEDIGFFCVDNLPIILLSKFTELCLQTTRSMGKVALGIDIREGVFLKDLRGMLNHMRQVLDVKVWFFEASDRILQQRFSVSRRPHPLSSAGSILEGIKEERNILSFLREEADRVVDTSSLTVHELNGLIKENFLEVSCGKKMKINLTSFGYRYGLPYDADIIMDVRFLPNPYFVEGLRDLTGMDVRVKKYVMELSETTLFLEKFSDMARFLLPLYVDEGKTYLTVAIGCTGGKHRSVALVEWLSEFLREEGYNMLSVNHRDIQRPQ